MTTLATIGYERSVLADVIDRLQAAGVRIVIDVRAVASSRRAGFSKTLLAASLGQAGIDYLHLRAPEHDGVRRTRLTAESCSELNV